MILDFSGLRVLVTGGAGGIGTEICRELHALGAEVVVTITDQNFKRRILQRR